jgi:hypothetical protein
MKKGKTTKLSGYKSFKSHYGTIDSQNLKSIYINIQTWVEPKIEVENWNRVVQNMSRSFKHSILNHINKEIFDVKFIVDLDLRTSGLQLNKKSFMNLEITLFLIESIDFKSPILKKHIKKLIKDIYGDVLNKNKYFKLNLTKNGKIKNVKSVTNEEL